MNEPSNAASLLEARIQILKNQAPEDRQRADSIFCTKDFGYDATLLAALLETAQYNDAYFRAAAIYALRYHAYEDYAQWEELACQKLAGDPEPSVRSAAAYTLAYVPSAAPALLTNISDESAEVRAKIVDSLGHFLTDEAFAAIKDRLHNDKEPIVRRAAAASMRFMNVVRRANAESIQYTKNPDFLGSLHTALSDTDAEVRCVALEALHQCVLSHEEAEQSKEVVSKALLSDPEISVRLAAATALGFIPSGSSALLANLNDENAQVRAEIVSSLGNFQMDETAAALKDRLHHDQDPEVRGNAAYAMEGLSNPDFVDSLLAAVADADANVRCSAIRAARQCAGFSEKKLALHPIFIQSLSDPSDDVRECAAESLLYSSPDAIPALMLALTDKASKVRLEAARALGTLEAVQAIDALAERLQCDTDEEVRYYAASSLGELAHERATQHLITALENTSETLKIRQSILDALGESRDIQALPVLCAMLKDSNVDFRIQAAESLGDLFFYARNCQHTSALEPLCAALKDASSEVRANASEALGKLRNPEAIPFLIPLLQNQNESNNVRKASLEAIAWIDAPGNAALILAYLNDPCEEIQEAAAEGLELTQDMPLPEEALAYLANPDMWFSKRIDIAKALARQGHSTAVPFLIAALQDDDSSVRAGIAEALRDLPDPRAVLPLIAQLDDADEEACGEAALTLAAIGDERAIASLAALRKHESHYVRRRAVRALVFFKPWNALPLAMRLQRRMAQAMGKTVPPDVLPLLIDSLQDDDEHVMQQAVEALLHLCKAPFLRQLLLQLPPTFADARAALEEGIAQMDENQPTQPRLINMGTLHYE